MQAFYKKIVYLTVTRECETLERREINKNDK
jgi:hypothetical protein